MSDFGFKEMQAKQKELQENIWINGVGYLRKKEEISYFG